jgi:hypothetical protein
MLKSKKGLIRPKIRELIQDVKFEDRLSEGQIIRQKDLVIWWLIFYISTNLWGVICL